MGGGGYVCARVYVGMCVNVEVFASLRATVHQLHNLYLVSVSKIDHYFCWLPLCDRACPGQPSALFLSRVLLLGFGKLASIKKKCHCRFVLMCVGFTMNCQNKSRSKTLCQTFTRCFLTYYDPYTGRYVYITDYVHDETYFKARV